MQDNFFFSLQQVHTKNNKASLNIFRKSNHSQFTIVSRISHRQIEIREVYHIVFTFSLLVEETNFGGPTNNIIGNHPLNKNSLRTTK